MQQVYEQLTQREARLKDAQAAAAADADSLRADLATREAAAAAKLRATEETEARLQSRRDEAEKSRRAIALHTLAFSNVRLTIFTVYADSY